MNMSACIAVRLSIVSSSDSPLAVLERVMSRLNTSADSRRAAISKVVRVRVLFSKNRLKMLLPRSSGTFFTSRSAMLMKLSAVVSTASRIGRGRPSIDSRWCSSPWRLSWGLLATALLHLQVQALIVVAGQDNSDVRRHFNRCADERRGDRQFAAATVDQYREVDAVRSAVVEDLVHRRAHGAAGIKH